MSICAILFLSSNSTINFIKYLKFNQLVFFLTISFVLNKLAYLLLLPGKALQLMYRLFEQLAKDKSIEGKRS